MEEINILDELMIDIEETDWDECLKGTEVPKQTDGKENHSVGCPVPRCHEKTFKNAFTLQRHWTEVHQAQIKLHECRACKRIFRRSSDAKRHSMQFHGSDVGSSIIVRENKFYIDPEGHSLTSKPKGEAPLKKRAVNGSQPSEVASKKQCHIARAALATVSGADSDSQTMAVNPEGSDASCSQMAKVPGAGKVGTHVTAPLPTSRDMLLRHLMDARHQVQHWLKVEKEAKEALNIFDREKEKARVKDLERLLAEERAKRRDAEKKVRQMERCSALREHMDFVDFLQANQHFN